MWKQFAFHYFIPTNRSLVTNDELVHLDSRWKNHVRALNVDDAEETSVS